MDKFSLGVRFTSAHHEVLTLEAPPINFPTLSGTQVTILYPQEPTGVLTNPLTARFLRLDFHYDADPARAFKRTSTWYQVQSSTRSEEGRKLIDLEGFSRQAWYVRSKNPTICSRFSGSRYELKR